MPITRLKTINPRNAYLARQAMLYFEPLTNTYLPWAGRTDVTVRFSTDPDGFTDTGYPDTLLGPYPMTETADPGVYYAEISGDDLSAALLARVGETIYQIVEANYGSYYNGLTDVQPLLVVEPRAPLPGSP